MNSAHFGRRLRSAQFSSIKTTDFKFSKRKIFIREGGSLRFRLKVRKILFWYEKRWLTRKQAGIEINPQCPYFLVTNSCDIGNLWLGLLWWQNQRCSVRFLSVALITTFQNQCSAAELYWESIHFRLITGPCRRISCKIKTTIIPGLDSNQKQKKMVKSLLTPLNRFSVNKIITDQK